MEEPAPGPAAVGPPAAAPPPPAAAPPPPPAANAAAPGIKQPAQAPQRTVQFEEPEPAALAAPSQQPAPQPQQQQQPPAHPPPPVISAARGRRKGVKRPQPAPEELVRLGPEVAPTSERLRTGWHPVQLSEEDKAAELELDEAQTKACSRAGYRMVRATHGAFEGTWYFEVRIDQLGPTGAARVGWCTRKAEINAPVGADEHGFSYRSLEGSKVHKGWRDPFGEAFGEGDTVGCLLHLPPGGRPFDQTAADVVKYKGKLHFPEDDAPAEPQPLPGSFVGFTLNGIWQGKAYEDLREGTYLPAVSLYTNPTRQQAPAVASVNFGEKGFAFPPPVLEGCPAPRPACELSGPRPGAAPAAVAQPAAAVPVAAAPPAPAAQQQAAAAAGASAKEQQQQEHLEQQQQGNGVPAEQQQPANGLPAQQQQEQQQQKPQPSANGHVPLPPVQQAVPAGSAPMETD